MLYINYDGYKGATMTFGRAIQQRTQFFLNFLAVCALSLAVAGCASTGTKKSETPSTPMTSKDLVYGITLSIPDGWGVPGSAAKGLATNEVIDNAIKKGNRVPVIDMFHPADTAEDMDARMGLFLVDATKNFMPQAGVSQMTEQDFAEIAKNILEGEREQAAREKKQSNMLEWKVYRSTIAGHLAVVQEGRGKKPTGGEMLIYYADIYLPNNKGLAIRGMSDANAPSNMAVIKSVVSSVVIK